MESPLDRSFILSVKQHFQTVSLIPNNLMLHQLHLRRRFDRQRALSYWSFGFWGGSGVTSFAGGAIATYMGWKCIFIFSIIFALLGNFIKNCIQSIPEIIASYFGLVPYWMLNKLACRSHRKYSSSLFG